MCDFYFHHLCRFGDIMAAAVIMIRLNVLRVISHTVLISVFTIVFIHMGVRFSLSRGSFLGRRSFLVILRLETVTLDDLLFFFFAVPKLVHCFDTGHAVEMLTACFPEDHTSECPQRAHQQILKIIVLHFFGYIFSAFFI